jgi:PAS domain S-box-containing protein
VTNPQRTEGRLQTRTDDLMPAFVAAGAQAQWETDTDGRVVTDSPSWRAYTGQSVEEMLGYGWLDAIHPDDRANTDGQRQEAVVGGRLVNVEFRLRRAEGGWRWTNVRAAPLRDSEGRIRKWVGLNFDITERKKTEDALQRSEERLRVLIENSADMILVVDGEGRTTFGSPSVSEVFGRTEEEYRGKPLLEYLHPEDRESFVEAFRLLLVTPGAVARHSSRFLHKDGSWRVLEAVARNLLDNPVVNGVVVNARDVTVQHQTEAQLRHAQRMDSVGRLAGGIAHDFNNLLTVIMAAVAELQDAAETRTPVDKGLVEDVADATSRARDLTRQLLLFARKQVVIPVPLDLNDVVANNLNLLRRTLGEDVEAVVALHDGLGLTHCDPGQAAQVLMNLAVNARDAMPNGGTLTIGTSNVDLTPADAAHDTELRPGSWVRLLVRDSGVGITPEVMAHLFEPFFTTKPRGLGTGLGLATIHGIVAQSKGFIVVKSEPGIGSTFEVYLPRADASVRLLGTSGAEKRPSPGTETVLVVDDEPSVLEAVGRTLRNAGYEVLMATEGHEALDLEAEDIRRLHLLVTDLVMPGLSGGEVAVGLRHRHPNLPVLFMSGFTDNTVALEGPLEQNTNFIGKPFAPEELLAKVRAVLASAPRT